MATIDSSLVRQELKSIIASSQGLAQQAKPVFERLETDPSTFDKLEHVDPAVEAEFSNVTLRKAYLTSGRHDIRIIFAHWNDNDIDHVDLLLAFPRKQGYEIDWAWIANILHKVDPT